MRDVPRPNFAHLLDMSGPLGTFEHAKGAEPRLEHGYCVDDVARVAILALREPDPSPEVATLARRSLDFLRESQDEQGRCQNRRTTQGEWFGPVTREDCWGRSQWALGTAVGRSTHPAVRDEALRLFERGATAFSPYSRAMAFATLGAVEVVSVLPGHVAARELMTAACTLFDLPDVSTEWPWGEARLRYSNAAVPEAMIAAGHALNNQRIVALGLSRLSWLLDLQTRDGVLSVTPAAGWGPGDDGPRFDQQPIEVAALAEACVRAYEVTNDHSWLRGLELAVDWFQGRNDVGAVMWDTKTGGGYDGLTPKGPNKNQGAESTIALLSTFQMAQRYVRAMS